MAATGGASGTRERRRHFRGRAGRFHGRTGLGRRNRCRLSPTLYGDSRRFLASLRRSEDGGGDVGRGRRGLARRHRSIVLVTDPQVLGDGLRRNGNGHLPQPGAAAETGLRSVGRGWPIGITSLELDATGAAASSAGTTNGAYELEIARGPLDVPPDAAGASRLLVWDGERDRSRIEHWRRPAVGRAVLPERPRRPGRAVALAEGGGDAHVRLWQNGDGRSALEIRGAVRGSRQSGACFEKRRGWIPSD